MRRSGRRCQPSVKVSSPDFVNTEEATKTVASRVSDREMQPKEGKAEPKRRSARSRSNSLEPQDSQSNKAGKAAGARKGLLNETQAEDMSTITPRKEMLLLLVI